MITNKKYTFYADPGTEIGALENKCISKNDFPINQPIDFIADHRLENQIYNKYFEAIDLIGIENPIKKFDMESYERIKKRVRKDFSRLTAALAIMQLPPVNKTLFITIGNSMESYGYMLKKVFPNEKIGHIKVSRTMKDNIERYVDKNKRIDIFQNYFHQKISQLIKKNEDIRAVIIIDTCGAGETMSTIIHPFMNVVLEKFPSITVFPACLLEAGHLQPTPPYNENIKLIHLPQADEYMQLLDDFRSKANSVMPVFIFNEYIPLDVLNQAINDYYSKPKDENVSSIIDRFRFKELKLFLELQQLKINNKKSYIVIPSRTTRLLSPINPYITVTQKTVFMAKDNQSGEFITRDGHGFSRHEKPPMKLHRLYNHISFNELPMLDKVKLLFEKDIKILNSVSSEVKNIVSLLTTEDIEHISYAFESFLRKKIIYHHICKFEYK